MNSPDTSTSKETFKSGFVAFVGRPNAGKSTLINKLVGKKVAITSDTAQTTRKQIFAIKTSKDCQIVFIDTPGLHKPHDLLGEELNKSALTSLEDADVAAFLIAADKPVGTGDTWVASHFNEISTKKFLVITKSDKVSEEILHEQIEEAKKLAPFDQCIVTSAYKNFGTDELIHNIKEALPPGPQWFPDGMTTNQSFEMLVAEIIREKALLYTSEEVPHSIGVLVEDDTYDKDKDLTIIYATIYVERASQKGILIGKRGSMIKRIGTDARKDLKRIIGGSVHLNLTVQVKKNWRRYLRDIQNFGYGEEQ